MNTSKRQLLELAAVRSWRPDVRPDDVLRALSDAELWGLVRDGATSSRFSQRSARDRLPEKIEDVPEDTLRWVVDFAARRSRRAIRRLPLRKINVNVTYRCDLACIGCNRACFVKPHPVPDLTLERFAGFLAEVKAAAIPLRVLRITGGEPTLHPRLDDIIGAALAWFPEVRIHLFSNGHGAHAQRVLSRIRVTFPTVRAVFPFTRKPGGSVTHNWASRFMTVSPADMGIALPRPCFTRSGGRCCIPTVDQLGYTLCPSGGAIDTLLDLNARASRLEQLADPAFVANQARALCSHCGQFSGIPEIPTETHAGTPVSPTWAKAIRAHLSQTTPSTEPVK